MDIPMDNGGLVVAMIHSSQSKFHMVSEQIAVIQGLFLFCFFIPTFGCNYHETVTLTLFVAATQT